MEIRQVQSFVHVARLGSFSRAAETMGYSQSAITVQIRLLEEELGTKLFDRMGKKVSHFTLEARSPKCFFTETRVVSRSAESCSQRVWK